MAATLAQRVQDLIGFDYSDNSINTENEALETACAEIIDLAPTALLLKYAVAPYNLVSGSTTINISGKKILRVIRYDTLNSVGRLCEKVDLDEWFLLTSDTNSIYYPTDHSPVYTENRDTLEVFPAVTGSIDGADSAKVFYIIYPTGDNIDSATSISGLPNELEHAVALKASIYILQTLISDAVQDDEDDELQNMYNNQKQSLQGMYQAEIQRLTGDKGTQTGE